MKRKFSLMSCAASAVLALAPAWGARAQDASDNGKAIQDVVITATKTGATNLQKTPIAVDVVSGSDLTKDNLRTFKDLTQAVPSLQITQNYQDPEVYIRGVGGNNGNADDSDVGIYLDGVYLSRPLVVMETDFNDIDRVEVVEGPQGTLFGRNSAGGAINFISKQAPDHFEFQNTLNLGNYSLFDEAARIGGPISDNIQASLSFSHVQHDGYLHNVDPGVGDPDAANRTALRGQIRWEITPDITNTVRADYFYTNENWVTFAADQALAGGGAPTSYDPLLNSITGKLNEVDMGVLPHISEVSYGVNDEFNWKFNDNLSLKSLTALNTENNNPIAGNVGDVVTSSTITTTGEYAITQEFDLANHYGPLSGVLGYFYFDEHMKFTGWGNFDLATPPVNFPGEFFQITEMPTISQAVFLNETYQVTPTVGITVGGRYTSERRSLINTINEFDVGYTSLAAALAGDPVLAACVSKGLACGGNYVGDLNHTYTAFTPKASVNWQATPDTMLYASATNGFKSGGFNFTYTDASSIVPPNFGPETIWSYEIGAKNDLFDHTLRLNLALFRYDWTGLQFSSLVAPATSTVANAGNAELTGLEVNFLSKPAQGWTFTGGLTWLSTEYLSFTKYSVPGGLKQYLTGNPNFSAANGTLNATGNQLADAPPVTVNLTGQRDFDLADGADLFLRAEYQYTAKTFFDPSNVEENSRPAFSLINASVGYSPAHSHWTVALWGKNLTNQLVPEGYGAGSPPLGFFVNDPRTFGVRINYTY